MIQEEEVRTYTVNRDKYYRAIANVYIGRESVNKKIQKRLKQEGAKPMAGFTVSEVIDGDTFKVKNGWGFRLALAKLRMWTSLSDNLKRLLFFP